LRKCSSSCKHKTYLADLPTVSAIVPFWNEHFSTLLRTAQSMLNRAPSHLLLEVILVNDFSDIGFTWTELNDHVMEHYGDRVKVIHSKERIGLMAARTAGARIAKGDVLVFVDAHTEANVNWLPPLVEPIALNYRTVTVPYVDSVDVDKFAYRENDKYGHRGIFDWKFLYHQLHRKPADIKDPIEPFQTPVMNGGLFAISAKWFWELGGYDEGLDVWGGEQFEISFKLWQCGGEMYDIPCSRFGHVFRRGGKEFKNPRNFEFLYRNYKRVAEVWMDDYKQHIYSRRPELFASIDAGDLTKPKAIREKLHCKSFQWYLDEIATEVLTTYPPVVPFFTSGAVKDSYFFVKQNFTLINLLLLKDSQHWRPKTLCRYIGWYIQPKTIRTERLFWYYNRSHSTSTISTDLFPRY
jgi:polypeptide N-acetylgalactosaminyltransferase